MKVILKRNSQVKEVSREHARHLRNKGALLVDPFKNEIKKDEVLELNDYKLSELRDLFPDVKARSKKEFLENLGYDSTDE